MNPSNPFLKASPNHLRSLRLAVACGLVALGSGLALLGRAGDATAAPRTCFGKKVNEVVRADGKTVRLGFGDVAWIEADRATVIGAPYSRICADAGRQTVRTGKGRTMTSTGAGDDRIFIGKGSNSIADAGLGNDTVTGSKGHDFIYASPKKNPRGLADVDIVRGAGGNDRIFDYWGEGNQLHGEAGVDTIRSEGSAVSTLNGGDGSDFLFSDGGLSDEGMPERMLGERGNDRLNGNLAPSDGPVLLNGGSGDDWLNGGSFADTAIANSGIVKIDTGGGDDLILAASAGRITMDGGDGSDTVSWAPHTPSGTRSFSGVRVNLSTGEVSGVGEQTVEGIENVIGSSFDDRITGAPGVENLIEAGIGDDELIGQSEDSGDGGLGTNVCSGFPDPLNCDGESPGGGDRSRLLVDLRSGVLTVIGSLLADQVEISWSGDAYLVKADSTALISDTCSTTQVPGQVSCPARTGDLSGMLVYGNDGDDDLTIAGSVPAFVTATIDGGDGSNTMNGGPTRDYMVTGADSDGTVMYGNGNADQLILSGDVSAFGGPDSDVLKSDDPCAGGRIAGGTGNDNAVFAGAERAVKADLASGYARAVSGSCAGQLGIDGDVEALEGSRFDDVLILGRKLPGQGSRRSLLGREGNNVLNSRNGSRDTVTTGPNGKKNRVIADPADKVIYGWGFAAF